MRTWYLVAVSMTVKVLSVRRMRPVQSLTLAVDFEVVVLGVTEGRK
jgi:hypothetical protein